MHRLLPRLLRAARLATASLLGAGLLAAGLGTPAHADTVNYDILSGYASFWVPGRVPGQPGNSHSGYVVFNQSDHSVMLVDWRCPRGVVPPDSYYAAGDPTNGCTVLRSRTGALPTRLPAFHGVLGASWSGTLVSSEIVPDDPTTIYSPVSIAFRQAGPVTLTVDDQPENGFYTKTRTAPMRLTGRLDWVRFGDPRTRVRFNYYDRTTEYLYD